MAEKKKKFYLGLNLIAPGIGQFALGSYIRGGIMFIIAILSTSYAFWLIVNPMYTNVRNMLDGGNKEIVNINLRIFFSSLLVLGLVWIWSFIDVFIRRMKS